MEVVFLTLFPDAMRPYLEASLLGKAAERGLVRFEWVQIRDFALDKHRSVDDVPFGGGAGMLLKVDVLHAAWKAARGDRPARTVLLSPQGRVLDGAYAAEMARRDERLILVCGHYEGVDERFIEMCVDEEISIGDYVLTGGELPALVLAEAVVRRLPGVVGDEGSVASDSLEDGLLKYPQFTRPREYEGRAVPDVLLSGNHGAIERWRVEQSAERTRRKRPDLKR